jgi:hypothetical protein
MFKQCSTVFLMILIEEAHNDGDPVPVDVVAELGSRGIIITWDDAEEEAVH